MAAALPHGRTGGDNTASGDPRGGRLPFPWDGGGAATRAGAAAPGRAAAFPASLPKAVQQAREAAKRALADGARLVEVEVPVGDITGVPGDGEGANEMTESMRATYDFLRAFSGREEGVR